jgi:8-hydroxy-5-deazaflavin:NADPH oxidoreductase
MNPYSENLEIIDLDKDITSSEEVAKQIPNARVVKVFNTIYYRNLSTKGNEDLSKADRLVILLPDMILKQKLLFLVLSKKSILLQ